MMFGALGMLLSSTIKQLENFAGMMNFVIFPMFFASSALYPLWKMREGSLWLYYICLYNPFTYAVELIRFAFYLEVNWQALAVVMGCTRRVPRVCRSGPTTPRAASSSARWQRRRLSFSHRAILGVTSRRHPPHKGGIITFTQQPHPIYILDQDDGERVMAFELRRVTFQVSDPRETVGLVSFFAGEASEPEQLGQWISGQVISDEQNMKSVALNQISALHAARELIDKEIQRLTGLYHEAEKFH